MKYGKKPVVKRFRLQETKPGRIIRKAVLERKEHKRPIRKGKPMKKGR